MQKKLLIFLCALCFLLSSCGKEAAVADGKVYFIDRELLMLVGVPASSGGSSLQEKADGIIKKLVAGQDFNRKIKRQIPNIKNGIRVKVTENIATVNLSSEFVSLHEEGRIAERLTVYQIVNSLTSLDGIDYVSFKINGKTCKNFKGFLDMRQYFTYSDLVL